MSTGTTRQSLAYPIAGHIGVRLMDSRSQLDALVALVGQVGEEIDVELVLGRHSADLSWPVPCRRLPVARIQVLVFGEVVGESAPDGW